MRFEVVRTLGGWSVRRNGAEVAFLRPVDHTKYGYGHEETLTETQAIEVQRVLNLVTWL